MKNITRRLSILAVVGIMILSLSAGADTKTNAEMANEVLQGKWGNFPERKDRLEEVGYDYQEVQDIVNELVFGDSALASVSYETINSSADVLVNEPDREISYSADSSAEEAFYNICSEKGLSQSEIEGWAYIINNESSWVITATNAESGAYGLPQSLPGSKMASHGSDWQSNPYTQLYWMYDYMVGRYGSIQGAVDFWYANSWY